MEDDYSSIGDDYTVYMDYVDLAVQCLRKTVEIYYSLIHLALRYPNMFDNFHLYASAKVIHLLKWAFYVCYWKCNKMYPAFQCW